MQTCQQKCKIGNAHPRGRPGQARPSPSFAQARFLEIWKSGTWKSGNLGSKKIQKLKILKIEIRVAQNVGKVWISRKKSSWPHFMPFQSIFCVSRENRKNAHILPIFLGGPMGPIHPIWALAAIHPWWGNRYLYGYFSFAQWRRFATKSSHVFFSQ